MQFPICDDKNTTQSGNCTRVNIPDKWGNFIVSQGWARR